MLNPDVEKGGRGKKASLSEEFPKVSSAFLSMARYVLRHDEQLLRSVLAG